MACYHPLHAFQIGKNEKSGKPKYQIESGRTERIHPREGRHIITDRWIENYVEIPCGKCIGCRLDYSRQWATRCMLEAKQFENNAFITLTYEDNELHYKKGCDLTTGEVKDTPTLYPKDLTKFMKDLRRYYEYHYEHKNIRFYACGEYGSTTERPHYHLIVFNLPIYDKKYLFTNAAHDKIYTSEIIREIWGRGHITVGEVTWNSAAYTARYIMKKIKGKESKEIYKLMGKEPEFTRMSRREGIGRKYYEENKQKIYECDEIILTGKKGKAQIVKPSKYYDKLFDIEEPECMAAIKKQRKEAAEYALAIQLGKTNLTKEEYFELKERKKIEQIKQLKRQLN